jgi:hypothetical protein
MNKATPYIKLLQRGLSPDVPTLEIFHFTVSVTRSFVRFDVTVSNARRQDVIFLLLTNMLSSTVTTPNTSQFVQLVQQPSGDQINENIYSGYVTYFGALQQGRKIFIQGYIQDQDTFDIGKYSSIQDSIVNP